MQVKQYPFYIKSTVILFGIVLFTYTLDNLKGILSPLAFASIIAILLNPLVNKLKKNKVPNVFAIIIAMLAATIAIAGIIYFLSSQISRFSDSFPLLVEKFNKILAQLQQLLLNDYNVAIKKQVEFFREADRKSVV